MDGQTIAPLKALYMQHFITGRFQLMDLAEDFRQRANELEAEAAQQKETDAAKD